MIRFPPESAHGTHLQATVRYANGQPAPYQILQRYLGPVVECYSFLRGRSAILLPGRLDPTYTEAVNSALFSFCTNMAGATFPSRKIVNVSPYSPAPVLPPRRPALSITSLILLSWHVGRFFQFKECVVYVRAHEMRIVFDGHGAEVCYLQPLRTDVEHQAIVKRMFFPRPDVDKRQRCHGRYRSASSKKGFAGYV